MEAGCWGGVESSLQGIGLALELDIELEYVELDFEVDVDADVVAVVEVSDSIASGSVLTRTALFDDRFRTTCNRKDIISDSNSSTDTNTDNHPSYLGTCRAFSGQRLMSGL